MDYRICLECERCEVDFVFPFSFVFFCFFFMLDGGSIVDEEDREEAREALQEATERQEDMRQGMYHFV